MISIAQPLLGDEEARAVSQVILSGQLAQGERVAEFERRFAFLCQVKEAVAVSSGTAALHLALLACHIGPGDEVITTPFSFAATANTILLTGARPVFVDIEPDTYNIDPVKVEQAITPATKAIIPVHLYGNPVDMYRLQAIARLHDIAIIEDACQAHAAAIDGKPVGSFGIGCFSFYPTKNMTTGEGGMVTTNDTAVAAQIRLWRSHGQKERYLHVTNGYNLRMTEIQAAIGLIQLEKLAWFTQRRIAHARYFDIHLAEHLQTPVVRPGHHHVYHQYTIRVPSDRDGWVHALRARGIETGIHYPRPIHQQPFYQEQGFAVSLPIAEEAAKHVLCLPVHPALSESDLATIVREVVALCH